MKSLILGLVLTVFSVFPAFAGVSLKGTGSTLAAPLYFQWMGKWVPQQPDVKIRYEAKDSNEGVNQALGHGSDFAATDTPLDGPGGTKPLRRVILHLPVALEAVAIHL